MKKSYVLLICLLLSGASLFAQQISVSGTVTDSSDGSTLPGVTIQLKGTSQGTISDIDGRYHINVPADGVLVYSFIGMTTREVPVNGRSVIDLSLESATVGLDEVIVIAYGTVQRASFTGSASSIRADQIERVPVTSFEHALEGAAPGLQLGNTSGQLGAVSELRIRGVGSISSSNEPLYVIDGIPVVGENISNLAGSTSNPLAALNPNDIASVTILKDAAAASLYGSRAANGVILITTKSGQDGKTLFRLRSSYGYNDFAGPHFEVATADQMWELKREGFFNQGRFYMNMNETDANAYAVERMNTLFWAYDPSRPASDYDWQGALFRNGVTHSHEFSASGGSANTRFFTSVSYNQQDGNYIGNDYERVTGRLNLDHTASDYIAFGINASLAYTDQNAILDGGSAFVNPIHSTRFWLSPLQPIYNEDGTYFSGLPQGRTHVLQDVNLNKHQNKQFRSMNKVYLQVTPVDGLNLRSTFGYDALMQNEDRYWSPLSRDGSTHNGYAHKRHRIFNTLTSSTIANYSKTVGHGHNLDMLAGFEVERLYDELSSQQGNSFPNAIIDVISGSANPLSNTGFYDNRRLVSVLSRLNYNYQNTYYFSASYRRDGSSQLGQDNRWGDFYSVSGSVRLSQMDFMQDFNGWLSDWKIRASYGTNGNLPTALYGHLALYTYAGSYDGRPVMSIGQTLNPGLSWEKNEAFNVGTDFTLFDRVTIDVEYYNRVTKDLLLQVPVSRVSGFDNIWQNIGSMRNSGIELSVNSTNMVRNDFVWTSNLNISHNRNEILELYAGEDIIDGVFILSEGHSFNTLFVRDWAGVDPTDGMGMWYTHDEDGNRNGTTKNFNETAPVKLGSIDPAFTGGIYNTFSYKGFDLSALFTFSVGGYIYANATWYTDHGNSWFATVTQYEYNNTWRQPGDNSVLPRFVHQNPQLTHGQSSLRRYENDFLRLKSLNIGYTLPGRMSSQIGLDQLRIYMSGRNLLTWSKVDLVDPESGDSRGLVFAQMPQMRVFTFGIEVSF